MKTDTKKTRRLRTILSVQSHSREEERMIQSILARLLDMKKSLPLKEQKNFIVEVEENGNVLVTKGKIRGKEKYPCVVCHTDTVHDIVNKYEVMQMNGHFFAMEGDTMKQTGIGGDDKVGVFITLEMLMEKPKLKAVFFVQEEIGCIGSRNAPKKFFKNCGYILQCDRKENEDFVNEIGWKELFSEKFSKAIAKTLKKHGYKETNGGSTDVAEIKDKVDICVANMSCGYYRPHSNTEVVHIYSVMKCCNMVSELIELLGKKLWKHKAKEKQTTVPKHKWENYNRSNGKTVVKGFKNEDYEYKGDSYDGYYGGYVPRCSKCNRYKVFNIETKIYECPDCPTEEEKIMNLTECPQCQTQAALVYIPDEEKIWCWTCNDYIDDMDVIDDTEEDNGRFML